MSVALSGEEVYSQAVMQRVLSIVANEKVPQMVWCFLSGIVTMGQEWCEPEFLRYQPEFVLAIWLYVLYSTIYTSAFGTIPAGVLGIASLGVGLAAGKI